ncbi:uncharacterized protein K452DRAFT_15562 [Aplosporella prunicola CBS 121167]|uniref:Uncharacterized protein n=1 Tax=Aplosporella prunicola CBS 121167 TaxID=1176127 RepID=A0A6A6BG14_9PEZI|nr:uncharacterized protein K452DRAFT_15562 [Aplosporella prunicola CBS 121167]KAF2143100.1 hypothetical protein K452DRAFT_15562 [Aplosporella prunicola CBS 121167]
MLVRWNQRWGPGTLDCRLRNRPRKPNFAEASALGVDLSTIVDDVRQNSKELKPPVTSTSSPAGQARRHGHSGVSAPRPRRWEALYKSNGYLMPMLMAGTRTMALASLGSSHKESDVAAAMRWRPEKETGMLHAGFSSGSCARRDSGRCEEDLGCCGCTGFVAPQRLAGGRVSCNVSRIASRVSLGRRPLVRAEAGGFAIEIATGKCEWQRCGDSVEERRWRRRAQRQRAGDRSTGWPHRGEKGAPVSKLSQASTNSSGRCESAA